MRNGSPSKTDMTARLRLLLVPCHPLRSVRLLSHPMKADDDMSKYLDSTLLARVQSLTTGANTHELAFFVAAYKSLNCPEAEKYLRAFASSGNIIDGRIAFKKIRQERGLE